MDILHKLNKLIDQTVAADVAVNTGQGKIDVIGGKCPSGMVYDKNKKVCVPKNNEGMVYIYNKKKDKRIQIADDPRLIAKYEKKGYVVENLNEDIMKITSYKEKAGQFLKTVWKLELPMSIPEFGNTKYSSGTKDQMIRLAKKYGKKYGWTLGESSIVGGSYVDGSTVNIIGSAQTRAGFTMKRNIIDLARKEPVNAPYYDPTKTNILGRKGLKFDVKSGAYIPSIWDEEELQGEK